MLLSKFLFPFSVFILILLVLIGTTENEPNFEAEIHFMNGVSFVAPPSEFESNPFYPLNEINAGWVAVMPYAFSSLENPEIIFDSERQWWGETTDGTIKTIEYAKQASLKILLKPHVWIRGQGWTGDFYPKEEEHWQIWENSYGNYIMNHARIADSMNVEAFCIGLEFKYAVKERTDFWFMLIADVRKVYKGKICYAANWDNFQNIPFWDELDFIGINAYFPLSQKNTPDIQELMNGWNDKKEVLAALSQTHGKPIVFTEFGYRSIDKAAGNQWELEHHRRYTGKPNFKAQEISYSALFNSIWEEPWFRGGFIWKWYPNSSQMPDSNNSDYTPQCKPVEKVIEEWYKKR